MFITPAQAINEGWITHPSFKTLDEWEAAKLLSPNAIDFTLDRMFIIHPTLCVISETGKVPRNQVELEAIETRDTDSTEKFWTIYASSYDCMSNMYVSLPEGVACELIIRSTFNRNGMFLTSGLYDQGFQGNIGFVLHSMLGTAKIAQGVRVGQIKFISSETSGKMYEGGYNTQNGKHWTEDV